MGETMDKKEDALIDFAMTLLSTPYKYGVKPEEIPKFLDCSSLTQLIFKHIGIEIGRSTIMQALQGSDVVEQNILRGDLIFFRGSKGHFNDEWFPPEKYGYDMCIGHVALYIGQGLVIHANGQESVMRVVVEPLQKIVASRTKIVMIKRILC